MSYRIIIISLINLLAMTAFSETPKTLHDFTITTLEGEEFDMSQLNGKKVLIVNTASKCGNTPQYEGLQELYEKYRGQDFVIIGFPANNFLRQEPGSNEAIRDGVVGCVELSTQGNNLGWISVKGKDMHPIYQWLTKKDLNGFVDSSVKWNFQKYLVDEKGNLVGVLPPKTKPLSGEIVGWIME